MKKIIYIFSVLIIISSIYACEEFIDIKPQDQISADNYWRTATDLENYVLQFYADLPGHSGSGIISQDANSDNLISDTPDPLMNGERTTRTGNWINEWRNIRGINVFFDNYQKCEDDFEAYKHFLGEAQFFRAWFYFNLLKSYGDLPWYSKALTPEDEGELMLPRLPRTEIIDNILADVDGAILNLSPRSNTGNLRINKEVALAFKSRVALFEGTWQKYHANTLFGTSGANPNKYFQACVSASEELMTGNYEVGIYNTGNPDQDYYELFGLVNMSDIGEVLLYRSYNVDDGFGNTVQHFTTENPNRYGATFELISMYLSKDGTPYDYLGVADTAIGNAFLTNIADNCDPRLKSTVWIPGDLRAARFDRYFDKPWIDQSAVRLCPTGFQVKKTSDPNSPVAGGDFANQSNTGYIIFRYAEVLLNYAEALYELNQTVAYDQLNLLRERVGLPDFFVNSQSTDPNAIDYGYTISDELYEIRRERRVELALEGYREADYMRWAAADLFKGKRPKGYPFDPNEFPEYNPPLDGNGLIDYFANDLPDGYQFQKDRDYLTSIPQDELTLNPNLTQNPGW
jgi:hypothetical protein